jgi:hypothetical protein
MSGKIRRLDRISSSLFWGVEPDPEKDFWRSKEAWSILGALAGCTPSWRVFSVRLLETGRINRLKELFIKAGETLNEYPTPRQLRWALEALEKVKEDWKKAEWWADGELELDNPSAWLSGLFEQALAMLEAGRFYIKPVMKFTKGAQDYYYEPYILARDMEAQECAGKLSRMLGRDKYHPKDLADLKTWLIKQKELLSEQV